MRRACAAALLLCAALALAHAHAHSYKRAEMSASPFVLSSRYGRAAPRMSPRNDRSLVGRFFLTGRYGKRSGAADQLGGAAALELVSDRDGVRAGLASDRDRLRAGLASDRDRMRAGGASDRDARSWRPRCSCQPYAAARARTTFYKRAPQLVDSSSEGR